MARRKGRKQADESVVLRTGCLSFEMHPLNSSDEYCARTRMERGAGCGRKQANKDCRGAEQAILPEGGSGEHRRSGDAVSVAADCGGKAVCGRDHPWCELS